LRTFKRLSLSTLASKVEPKAFFANEKDALELWVFPASGLERARQSIKTLSPVTGLGQEAFITRNRDIPYIELYLKRGNVTLEVTMKEARGDE